MGHNVKNSTRRANIVTRQLSNFPDWRFEVGCPRCNLRRVLPVADLIQRFGGQHIVAEVAERFVCRHCRGMPDMIVISNRLHRVILHGTVAFA